MTLPFPPVADSRANIYAGNTGAVLLALPAIEVTFHHDQITDNYNEIKTSAYFASGLGTPTCHSSDRQRCFLSWAGGSGAITQCGGFLFLYETTFHGSKDGSDVHLSDATGVVDGSTFEVVHEPRREVQALYAARLCEAPSPAPLALPPPVYASE